MIMDDHFDFVGSESKWNKFSSGGQQGNGKDIDKDHTPGKQEINNQETIKDNIIMLSR